MSIQFTVNAQVDFGCFSTVGTNPVDNPVYSNIGVDAGVFYRGFYLNYAFDLNLTQRDVKPYNGIKTNLSYQRNIKGKPLILQANVLYKPSTQLIKEFNWGFMLSYYLHHWDFSLGTNFKSFHLNNDYTEEFSIESDVMKEKPGLTYQIRYFIFDRLNPDTELNIWFDVTNYDTFVIEQETNPFVGAGVVYNLPETDLSFFGNLYYQSAGFNNIRVNYFGFYFRTGVSWSIDY